MIRTTLLAMALFTFLMPIQLTAQAEEPAGEAVQEPAPAVQAEDPNLEFELGPVDGADDDLNLDGGLDSEAEFELIEGLLEEGDEVMEAPSAYDAGDRRDPFRSLIRTTNDRDAAPRGPRPEGVPGLLIDELSITGIWVTPDGPVAQVQSTDTPMSYLLRQGDQLYDGEVVRISLSREAGAEVQFKQSVSDSTAPKPFRDVVRRLDSQ